MKITFNLLTVLSFAVLKAWSGRFCWRRLCVPIAYNKNLIFIISGEEDDLDTFMKKSQMWPNGSDPLGSLKFGGLAMDASWMRLPQQRFGPMIPSPQNGQYRALAAAALQEFRNGDSSKQLLSQSVPSLHLPFRQEQSQPQPQQLMQHINDIPGPLLQLSTSQTQTTDLGNPGMSSASYRESDLHRASSTTMSNSFGLQDVMGRAPTSTPLSSSEGNQLASMMQITSQSGLQPSGTMHGLIQVLAVCSYNFPLELVQIQSNTMVCTNVYSPFSKII